MFLPSIPVLSAPRAVLCALASVVLFATVPALIAQNNLAQTAEDEAVRRQELSILLRKTLKDAQSDQKLGDLGSAARLYEECWDLVQKIGDAGIEKERQETIQGFSEVYITLAKKSYSRAQYGEARTQVGRVLRVDPKNRDAQNLLASVEKALKEQEGRIPSKDTLALLPDAAKTKTEASTMVQDGKLLYEMGKLDEAEAKLRQAGRMDPDNAGAFYYLRLVEEARYAQEARKRELMAKSKMVEVEKSWNPPIKWGNITNTSNPFARTNTIYTSPSRRVIFNKLDKIRFAQYPVTGEMPGVPLGIVVKDLDEEVRLRDPEKRGINFIIAPNIDIQTAQPGLASFDPTTGQPISTAPQQEQFDLANDVLIKIEPPLKDIRLADLLDAIVKVSNKQIKYSVEDYAIVFTRKIPEQDQLFTRTFRVNPNTFVQGLEGVIGYPFEGANLANSSTGGGTTGGTTGGGFGVGGRQQE